MELLLEDIRFAYPGNSEDTLKGISLELCGGRFYGLFGANGSGKSTLIRCMNHSLKPSSGKVSVSETELSMMSRREIATLIAVIAQELPEGLPFSVRELVAQGRYPHRGNWGMESREDNLIIDSSLERMNLFALADRPFSCLSGGEKQRVMAARALAQGSPVILMDEPASGLDISHRLEFFMMARALANGGKTVLMACHDIFMSPLFIQEAFLLHDGAVYARGAPEAILTRSALEETYGLNACVSWGANSFKADFPDLESSF